MIDTPRIVQAAAEPAAVIRVTFARDGNRAAMGAAHGAPMAAVAAQGVATAGPGFTHRLRSPGDTFDFEIGVPVAREASPCSRSER